MSSNHGKPVPIVGTDLKPPCIRLSQPSAPPIYHKLFSLPVEWRLSYISERLRRLVRCRLDLRLVAGFGL
eukprot:1320449-Amorphochlora_amoeboformis.AAC.1